MVSSLAVFLTELHYPVTGSGDEVTGNGDGHTKEIFTPKTLQNREMEIYNYIYLQYHYIIPYLGYSDQLDCSTRRR